MNNEDPLVPQQLVQRMELEAADSSGGAAVGGEGEVAVAVASAAEESAELPGGQGASRRGRFGGLHRLLNSDGSQKIQASGTGLASVF